ncbi:MAG TPA: hydantoinase/oxoprolinase family protein [Pyrinomonadaceae bacterium]|nr:hydantoinase/oxoprolinase family protein [Pyrinomonadaceae bacterium]
MKKKINRRQRSVRIGVDTGGTFTDFVFEADGELRVFKLASTPDDPSRAISEGLKRIVAETGARLNAVEVVHGTTVGTNALLQRCGARAALVTTAGFEDVIEIGRQARPELYNLNAVKPPPLVPSELRFGASERVAASGEVLETLGEDTIAALVDKLRKAQPESIAISLLFSFVRPEHEKRIAAALAVLGVPLSVSHQILPEYREYERTATVVINAYLQPLMGRYLNRLSNGGCEESGPASSRDPSPKSKAQRSSFALRVMQSSGGSISASAAASEPVRTILSGPAGGVVGALRAAQAADFTNIITFDMGGTSTDVALCDSDGMRLTNEAIVAGVPVAVPMMDIHTVGAGGGSIARVDEGGSLRVGPESSGADPGPACYGQSLLPTVTDAHMVLGHFPGTALLGGDFKLNEARARDALNQLANEMSAAAGRRMSAISAARGILEVVDTNMERALRHISVERGHDPRDFTLIPFGGAGGLHAVVLARALGIPRVVLPSSPGALSAVGVVTADVVKDQSRTVMLEAARRVESKLEGVFRELERSARATLRAERFPDKKQHHERSLAVRYKGQSFELQIKQPRGDVAAAFHRAHRARYGYAQEKNVVEIVSARVRSSGLVEKLRIRAARAPRATNLAQPHSFTETYFAGKKVRAAVYHREEVKSGSRLRAPCIVTEYSATTLVPEGVNARVDSHGSLLIDAGKEID